MALIDVVVMAHPLRVTTATDLADQVDARIVWDQVDDEWDTAARAWAAINPAADWGVVLQDDAVPIDDFRRHLTDALDAAPPGPVSLYVGTGRPHAPAVERAVKFARRRSASWLEHRALLWGVAVALPTAGLGAMLASCDEGRRPYDQRLSAWWRARRVPCRYTWPSLVDHADGTSLVLHPTQQPIARRAHQLGVPASWGGPVITF
jgi:hypothetical protein